jgi:hypothetical protein
MTYNNTANSVFKTNAYVSEDWNGGYKLEVDITTQSLTKDWTLDFQLPYTVRNAYGVNLIKNGNNSYSIKGQGDWKDLDPGENAKAIFIIDEYGKDAVVPKFTLQGSKITTQPKPTPPPISSNAIKVGFEKHSNNTSYNTTMQSKDWKVGWSNNMYKYATISDEFAHSGDKSLKITYPSDAQANTGSSWLVPSQKEYYLSYWVKFDQNFDFDGSKLSGGKLPGMGTDDLCGGGQTCTGTNGFTSRYMWRENGKATLYLYHMDKPGKYGEDFTFQGSDGNDKYFERGKWHNLIQRVKINDGNQSNGEVDVWMDKEKVLDLDNLKFVTDNKGIDTLYFSSFHGGNGSEWWPEKNVSAYFDDFVVSTNAADVGL